MSTGINKYGLKRHIPADTALQVRRECGFGCVICGLALYDYDHCDPPFEEAREHRAEGIALLCPGHHAKKTRRMISAQEVAAARKDPKALRAGWASDFFSIKPPFVLRIGNSIFRDVKCIVRTHEGFEWLTIGTSHDVGGPVNVNAVFYNSKGAESLSIVDNEWIVTSDVWDVVVEGPLITVRSEQGRIALELQAEAPSGLWIRRLDMQKDDLSIRVEQDSAIVITRGGGRTVWEDSEVMSADAVFVV